jgi:multiple sugar transport system ATP-binding protein
MAGLRINNLSKTYGEAEVLKKVSFEVEEGELAILLGPSGCGKSTILRLIAGLEEADSGQIYMGDRFVNHLSPKERDVAMVFQSYALYPHLNVFDNMAFSLRLKKCPREEIKNRVTHAARLLEIESLLNRKPRELSGGQRQRVAIGRAIVRSPKLFLFDEPLSNLDAQLRGSMRVELAKLHQELKTTTIYVTHDQVEAMTLGQKIILFDKGEIQQIGPPQEVYHSPENLFVATFIGSPPMNILNGRLSKEEGCFYFQVGKLSLNISFMGDLDEYVGKTVSLGIRPEAFMPGEGALRGKIEFVEHLGAEVFIYLRIQEHRIIARVDPALSWPEGQESSFKLNPTGAHLFFKNIRISKTVIG